MNWTQLWLLAFLAISCLTYLAVGSPLKVMSAPNLLRVGTAENIFVECQDCTGGDINVDISVMNFPTKTKMLASIHVTLTSADRFQGFGQITIPAEDFNKDPTLKQRVYLQAQFPDRLLEKVVLVSFQSGYIFIQTDKTLYTPNSIVNFRMFAVTPRMEPVERDTPTSTYASVTIEIVTPEDIIFSLDTVSLKSGIHSGSYQLGEIVSLGLWKVVARFHSNPQQSYSAEFEVKEYVLPSFEVKVIPTSSFFYVDSPQLTINIKATYLFGEEVDGTAFVVFGVVHEGQKKSFPDSIQRVPIVQGEGVVTLKRAHITQTFHINNLVGDSIFVAVSVLTENGGEMVQAELGGIQIVTSPYTVHFKKSPKYFKPGITCIFVRWQVEVLNRDETPAKGVEVVVDPGAVLALTDANGMARVDLNTMPQSSSLTITARTNDPGISRERQASATMTALPYKTKSNNYIHIGKESLEITSDEKTRCGYSRAGELGDNLKINFIFSRELNNQDTDVTYLILSRGQLVKHGHYRNRGQVLISLVFRITKEMLPSFRIIAYYHTNDKEVVSDSVWVDVKDSCMGSLTLESSRPAVSYEPRRMFGLKVTGDPGATVGLVAVDKIWDTLEKSDTGCTPGGGADSMGVFFDAGLLFESSTGSGTPYRQDLKCPSPTRRKRASRTLEVTTDLEEEDLEDRSNEIVSRTIFPESWLWSTIKLPACPGQEPNCVSTSFMKRFPLSDSITTWQIIGISLSRTHGICVSNPLEAVVSKQFFIDLKLPYSAVKGEQLEIKAVLHNYFPEPAIVLVELLEEEHVCSAASNRARYRHEVVVQPETTRSVPFIIIPMREGQFRIEVKAVVKDSSLSDGIRKMLRVVFSHWVVPGSHVYTMEATAYALLALVKVKMVSTYYNLPGEKKSDCEKFNLSVQILPENVDDDEKIYKLRIEVLYNDTERDAAMSVLDIGLPTGFTVNKGDLDLLSRNRTRTIANYEMTSVLSERDSLIIYLDKVSHTQPEEIAFRIHRTLKVDVLNPAAVSVYEYYDQTHCVKFYHPERSGELMRLCRNEECICGEGYCSKLQKDKTRHESRAVKACESTAAYRTDYVYKVRLAGFEQVSSVDIYTMEIVKVIKSGYTDVNPLNELRKFTSHPQCRQSLELTVGKTYLLMGTDKNIRRNPQSQMYEYDLLASNWIEYWPTDAECPAVQHRCNCVTLREFNAPACLQ